MDEKTEELRDIFIDTTGSDTVTERQEESRGSLTRDGDDVEGRLRELIDAMTDRYAFDSNLDEEGLLTVVRAFYDGADDETIADELGVDEGEVATARLDLHLVRESDCDAPFDFDALQRLVADGADLEAMVAELDADRETVDRYRRVAETEAEATRANDRFRDEFAELLTDSDLSGRLARDAREDGLEEATEDIETDVSF